MFAFRRGRGVLVRDNEMDTCGQTLFVNSQTPEGGIVYDLTIEGNYIHDWGAPGSDREHAMYRRLSGWQFNSTTSEVRRRICLEI